MPLIYVFHIAFYLLFLLRLAGGRGAPPEPAGAADAPAPAAAHPVRLVLLHSAAFAVLYFGLGQAVLSRRPTRLLFAPHPILGAAIIVAGCGLLAWALLVFRSWRLLARIERGHQLCTTGPFRLVRHPIYLALDLLALGTLVWVPTWIILIGVILTVLAGDLRARGEERLLCEVFGDAYRQYQVRVPRTVPGLY
jgi:protein-S-isoprenylcysteine O-methyltransferase Ste14